MNIKWPPEKTFEYEAHTRALQKGREPGIEIGTGNTQKKGRQTEGNSR